MTVPNYCCARTGRAGLGNMLLPWARCEIYRAASGAKMLAPRWTQPKIGPLLRGEKDKRYYVGLFSDEGYVTGLRRLWVLATATKVPEGAPVNGAASSTTLRVFRGMEGMFDPLLAHRELVRGRLWGTLSDRVRRRIEAAEQQWVVGVHVRRGDKVQVRVGHRLEGSHQTLRDDWYLESIRSVRRALGYDAPVMLFSDGRRHELQRLLDLPNVRLAPGDNPSIVDLLLLSRSKVLVSTGLSTFSMWASFLGQMPSLWYPGSRVVLNPERPGLEIETDDDGGLSAGAAELLAAAAVTERRAAS